MYLSIHIDFTISLFKLVYRFCLFKLFMIIFFFYCINMYPKLSVYNFSKFSQFLITYITPVQIFLNAHHEIGRNNMDYQCGEGLTCDDLTGCTERIPDRLRLSICCCYVQHWGGSSTQGRQCGQDEAQARLTPGTWLLVAESVQLFKQVCLPIGLSIHERVFEYSCTLLIK